MKSRAQWEIDKTLKIIGAKKISGSDSGWKNIKKVGKC